MEELENLKCSLLAIAIAEQIDRCNTLTALQFVVTEARSQQELTPAEQAGIGTLVYLRSQELLDRHRTRYEPLRSEWLRDLRFIGDSTCAYNAKSPYLQCAIAPIGDCKTCPHHTNR